MAAENTQFEGIELTGTFLDQYADNQSQVNLGFMDLRTDVRSTIGPFNRLPEYKVEYSPAIVTALGNLYAEYNLAFSPLVEANREWGTDYQYCMTGPNGTPVNYFTQIDMVGLPADFLDQATRMSVKQVETVLRGRIFELENSLAMYQLLEKLFSSDEQMSTFDQGFRAGLDALRGRFGKKIAILAVTDQKHEAIRTTEFGKMSGEQLNDDEVFELTGFDKLFGPSEFEAYVKEKEANGEECEYLLCVRSSDPLVKLKDPKATVSIPLLEDDSTRRIIKAHAITLNIDNPAWPMGDPRRINDTKEYLAPMGMAFAASSLSDILTPAFVDYLSRGKSFAEFKGDRLSPDFAEYLRKQGVDPELVASGQIELRFKPEKGTYGAYGHVKGVLGDREARREVRKGMETRGRYVIQPEMHTPLITNTKDGRTFTYIDRDFMAIIDGRQVFLAGFRTLMPTDTVEARRGRVHGNGDTVWAEIY